MADQQGNTPIHLLLECDMVHETLHLCTFASIDLRVSCQHYQLVAERAMEVMTASSTFFINKINEAGNLVLLKIARQVSAATHFDNWDAAEICAMEQYHTEALFNLGFVDCDLKDENGLTPEDTDASMFVSAGYSSCKP